MHSAGDFEEQKTRVFFFKKRHVRVCVRVFYPDRVRIRVRVKTRTQTRLKRVTKRAF